MTTLYSDPASRFMPLNDLGILQISGDDAQSFLQNLTTNDVVSLAKNQSQLSGICSAKGRLFAIFQLVRREGDYYVILPKSMLNILQPRLSLYILRSNVVISDLSDSLTCIGLASTDKLKSLDGVYFSLPFDSSRAMYIVEHQHADNALERLRNEGWEVASEDDWKSLDIKAGIPSIVPETKEIFTPQQVNFDLINGVSFNKGCYPGQEIVARLHYLGTPSRRMFLATIKADTLPDTGDAIITPSGDLAGHIVCISPAIKGSLHHLLVSLKLSQVDSPMSVNKSVPLTLISSIPAS